MEQQLADQEEEDELAREEQVANEKTEKARTENANAKKMDIVNNLWLLYSLQSLHIGKEAHLLSTYWPSCYYLSMN